MSFASLDPLTQQPVLDVLASTIETYALSDYTKKDPDVPFDRRLSLIGQGKRDYLEYLEVVEVSSPPGHRLIPCFNNKLANREALFTFTGLITSMSLPPFETTSVKGIRPTALLQSVTIIGGGSPSFDFAIDGLDGIFRRCERSFAQGKLIANTYITDEGVPAITATNRYFTISKEAGEMPHIPFTDAEDPSKVLRRISNSNKYRRTIDNQVSYHIMRLGTNRPELSRAEPHMLRVHDIVEVGVSITMAKTRHGCRFLPTLRSITLLEIAQEKLAIPRVPIAGRCTTSRECGFRKTDYTRYRAPEVVQIQQTPPSLGPDYNAHSTLGFGQPSSSPPHNSSHNSPYMCISPPSSPKQGRTADTPYPPASTPSDSSYGSPHMPIAIKPQEYRIPDPAYSPIQSPANSSSSLGSPYPYSPYQCVSPATTSAYEPEWSQAEANPMKSLYAIPEGATISDRDRIATWNASVGPRAYSVSSTSARIAALSLEGHLSPPSGTTDHRYETQSEA